MRDRLGTDVIALNTWQERVDLPEVRRGDRMRYIFTLPIDLKPGYYSLSPSVAYHQDIQQWMDWIQNALIFRVVDDDTRRTVFGVFLPHRRSVRMTPLPRAESSDPGHPPSTRSLRPSLVSRLARLDALKIRLQGRPQCQTRCVNGR